jgi:hypothetical protein
MKRSILLVVVVLVMAVVLSSCTINVFKPFDTPETLSNKAKSALEAANNGDTQSAIELSSQVLTTVASSQTESASKLYQALTTSATSPQSQKIIDEVASSVKEVSKKISNGTVSKESTQGLAIKDAAIAMIRSVSKVKKLEVSDVLSDVLNLLSNSQTKSARLENVEDSTSLDASSVSKMVLLLLSVARDMPTMNLMSELSSLVAQYGGDSAFNWDGATVLYDVIYVSTALFDSNQDEVLTTDDEIFNYVWDKSKNEFKNPNEIPWNKVEGIQLPTYDNPALCEEVTDKFSQAVSSFEDTLNHLPSSFSSSQESAENFLNYLEKIQSEMNVQKLSSFKTLGEIISFFANAF